jgi:uncharacterized protein (UPF0333 family)
MKELLAIALLLLANLAMSIETAPAVILPDFDKSVLFNYSNQIVTVYFYSGITKDNNSFATIDESSNLNNNRLGLAIQPGQAINIPANTKTVQIFYGSRDPINTTIDNSKSYKIIPSADRWIIMPLPRARI